MSLVAIVGRPNVGKSTLFNRLVGERKAIVDSTAGTTRDRHYGKTDWNGKEFSVIDTGGYTVNSDDIFEDEIRRQVMLAIDEADVILFLVEVATGITDLDQLMADILRRTSKKVILVCNKVDNNDQIYSSHEFYALGLGDPFCISSMSGSGTGDLMDAILAALPAEALVEEEENLPHITIVGRPNVGKSSMTNALLGEERNIVTSIAGTTRDSIHTRYNKFGMDFYLVDTAGMRKKGKAMEDLEFYSVMRSIRAIENSDVCILMLDAQQGLESQDLNIHNLIVRNRKGCVIVVNKWDLVEKDNNTMKEWTEFLKKKLAPFNDIPIIFTSVLSKQRIFDVLQTAIRVYESRKRRISTSALNDFLLPLIEKYPETFRLQVGDIRNPEDCRRAVEGMDYVLHEAALGSVPRSIKDPATTNDVNITGFLNMILASRDAGVRRFVFAASSSTYGDSASLPKVEEVIGRPLSPYAITKYVDELYADVFARTYPGFEYIGLRYFNVFGRRQDPNGAYAAVIPLFIKKFIRHEAPNINGDGAYSRDFTYIRNVVDMNLLALDTTDPAAVNQIYNTAFGERTTLNELVACMKEFLAEFDPAIAEVEPTHGPNRAGDIPHSLASIDKARRLLGYAPRYSMRAGLQEAIRWYWDNLR